MLPPVEGGGAIAGREKGVLWKRRLPLPMLGYVRRKKKKGDEGRDRVRKGGLFILYKSLRP